jgi:hypothetical protein
MKRTILLDTHPMYSCEISKKETTKQNTIKYEFNFSIYNIRNSKA